MTAEGHIAQRAKNVALQAENALLRQQMELAVLDTQILSQERWLIRST